MSTVWVKLLQAAPNSSRFTELGIDQVLVESKIPNQESDVADLRKTLITDVAFRNKLDGIASSDLKVYKNEADAGDPGKAIKLSKKLSELVDGNSDDNPLIVVVPPPPMYNFYIDPDKSRNLERPPQAQVFLYDGHRQSGKSTFCQALLRWFDEHPNKFLEITGSPGKISRYLINQTSQAFWESICMVFCAADNIRFNLDSKANVNSATFKHFFSKRLHPKKMILIIDEVSYLASLGDGDRNSKQFADMFISALRALKDDRTNFNLFSLAFVGTSKIRQLLIPHQEPGLSSRISPFSDEGGRHFGADQFTKEEYAKHVPGFDATGIGEISTTYLWPQRFVGVCGCFIEKRKEIPSLLPCAKTEHYDSIIRALKHLTERAKSILIKVLYNKTAEVETRNFATKYLVSEGMIVLVDLAEDGLTATAKCSASILRSLMLETMSIQEIELSEGPPNVDELDPRWLLKHIIKVSVVYIV
ncbi:hypothetical protein BDF19DRAFT_432396 [Syncephalis fuscata]|nr:hypothetical protein BDF19DRAFT_432396 [Syncephalis fuscata]